MSKDATLDEFTNKNHTIYTEDPQGVRLALSESYPKDWHFAELAEVCEINSGFTWSKDQEVDSTIEGSVPVIKIGNVQDGYLDLTDTIYLTGVSDEALEKNKARKDWLLMIGSNGSGERVGHCGIIEEDMEFVYASFLYGLYANSEYLLPRYLFYSLNRPKVQQRLTSFTAGSTSLKNLNKSMIENLSIPTPSLNEQRKIAAVLYTIDQAIKKTKEIIEQRVKIKEGLLQDIFLYGVDQNNTLRQSEGDNSFQDTKYGSVPIDWDVIPLSEIVPDDAPVTYGIVKPGDHHSDGVPVVKVRDIIDGEIKQDNLLHTSPEIHEKYKRAELNQGDLLFTIRGTVGRMAFVPENLEGGNLTQDTARIRVKNANPQFIRYFFQTATPNNYFERNTKGQAVQGINLEDLREVPVHLPSDEEQDRIVEILDSHTELIQKERAYLNHLRRLKQGLMQDLLMGIVRTTDTNITVPDKVAQYG